MNNMLKKILKNSERGQAIIIIAASLVGLVAIVGLMIDGGMLLIEYARLKRGIDSASIAAASQFRKDFVAADLIKAGEEFLKFNQSDAVVTIFTCDYAGTNHDETLCKDYTGGVARKLVRITASRTVEFGFMKIVGIDRTSITASSVGEAASIDLVLLIDTSSSMAYDTTAGGSDTNDFADPLNPDPEKQRGDDPVVCNSFPNDATKRCEPLGDIKDVAVQFVETPLLFYPYDQVAIIASTEQTANGNRNPALVSLKAGENGFLDNRNPDGTTNSEIQTAIRNLRVFQPVACEPGNPTSASHTTSLGGCIDYLDVDGDGADDDYYEINCYRTGAAFPAACGSSNIGGALRMAGRQFDYARQESFWVVIALIGGPATATDVVAGKPAGFCTPLAGRGCRDFDTPSINGGFDRFAPFTIDDPTKRHYPDLTDPANPIYPVNYDTDDFARDAADYVTSPTTGQGATMYSICLGSLCRGEDELGNYSADALNRGDPWSGEHLGKYMAEFSGGTNANHGIYKYTATTAGLNEIFLAIGNNIFTRISQ